MKRFADCYALIENSILKIGNDKLKRAWDISTPSPKVISVFDPICEREWVGKAPYYDSLRLRDLPLYAMPVIRMSVRKDNFHNISEKHLWVTVSLSYPNSELIWDHRIWPELPIIVSQFRLWKRSIRTTPVRKEGFCDDGYSHFYPVDDRLEFFGLCTKHLRYSAKALNAQSDYSDNPVSEKGGLIYSKEHIRLQGNYLYLRDLSRPGGLLALKLAPPPQEHLNYPGFDFSLSGGTLAIAGSGISAKELNLKEMVRSYGYAIGVTDGSWESGFNLCHLLYRKRMKPNPGKDFSISIV